MFFLFYFLGIIGVRLRERPLACGNTYGCIARCNRMCWAMQAYAFSSVPGGLFGRGLFRLVLDSEQPAEEAHEDVPFLGLLRLGMCVRSLCQGIFGRDKRVGRCQEAVFLQAQRKSDKRRKESGRNRSESVRNESGVSFFMRRESLATESVKSESAKRLSLCRILSLLVKSGLG